MNKDNYNLLTKNQFTFLIIGFAIGHEVLSLPNAIIENSKQDGWISAMIALIYPIYILIIANYIIREHPKENILVLNKNFFGYIFGNILNSVLLIEMILLLCILILDFSNITRIYITAFLTPSKVILVTVFLCVYAASKGLKVLAAFTELSFYMFIFLIMISFSALSYGSILNIQPIMGSGFKNIVLSTKSVSYYYIGFEFLLLYHPFVKDTKDIKKASLKAITIASLIWIWTVFITIFYLGVDIIPKSFYSFFLVFESIHLPLINNFRYIAMFIWTLVVLRMASTYYFSSSFILNDITKIHINKLNLLLSPIIFILCAFVLSDVFNDNNIILVFNIFLVFNVILLSILSLLVFIKSKSKSIPNNNAIRPSNFRSKWRREK